MDSHQPLLGGLSGDRDDAPDAVTVAGRTASWSELSSAGSALADRIAGAPAVAAPATASLETVVAVVAGLTAGVPVVPVPADSGPAERDHVLRDSGAALLVDTGYGGWPELELPAVPVTWGTRSTTSHPEPAPETTALIVYTSGTTGPPKGALIPRRAIAADLDALAEAWAWTAADVLVHGLPLFHVHGLVLGVLGPLRIGCRLVHTGRPTPQAYAAAGGTLYFGVPTVWSRVCDDAASAQALSSARLLVSGSAALPEPVFGRLRELVGQPPVERYGMTETLITVSSRADGERRPGMVGTPLRGIETRIAGEAGEALPHDGETIGELQLRGPTLFSGYHGHPETTAPSRTADGWFRTGDVATIGPDGWHRIVGRASTDLIITARHPVDAGYLETHLLNPPALTAAPAVGFPDPDLGQRIVAHVVASRSTGAELADFVARQLSAHKPPREVRIDDALPRNAMRKVQTQLLTDEQ